MKPAFEAPGARAYVFNVGDFPIDLAEVYGAGEAEKRFDRGELKAWFPSNTVLVVTPGAKVVVDPGDSARVASSMNPKPDPRRFRPVPLGPQLARAGVRPDEVTHVVITHLHFDHFAGVTRQVNGRPVALFPNARHLVPARDWDMAEIAEGRKKGDRDIEDTLGVIDSAGLVDLVGGAVRLGPGLALEPYPGESPGHQVLAVKSGGRACYCAGDLYHIAPEVDDPGLVAVWTDRRTLLSSRAKFAAKASKERALVLGGHMDPGTISLSRGKPRWKGA